MMNAAARTCVFLGLICLAPFFSDCRSSAATRPAATCRRLIKSPVSDTSYLLGPGDQLHVTIYDEEDLSGEVPVGDAGMAVLPLIGPVRAAGATPRQLEEAVRAKLISDHYLNDPNVTVQIIHFRPIYTLGEVHKPDDHPYVPDGARRRRARRRLHAARQPELRHRDAPEPRLPRRRFEFAAAGRSRAGIRAVLLAAKTSMSNRWASIRR
jgi:hypothetical protein